MDWVYLLAFAALMLLAAVFLQDCDTGTYVGGAS
jgi:hypothetical protein